MGSTGRRRPGERNVAGHYDQLSLFAGNSNPDLAQEICAKVEPPLLQIGRRPGLSVSPA